MQKKFENFILDVDGVLTDGKFHYTADGKVMKIFGSDDADALSLIKHRLNIHFVTGDHRGFKISEARIKDMGFDVSLVSTYERVEWIKQIYDLSKTIYMGDGIFDCLVFEEVGYSIAPNNGWLYQNRREVDFKCSRDGGSGAVCEAIKHIVTDIFQEEWDIPKLLSEKHKNK